MFFTPELLQRRDSGFGLLWLAATLGSKSSLKKLPRKGILTADIPALCTLISKPDEPLALRLSANLMVGVIRVYHARHEIWASEVTHCFTTLKKAVSVMYSEESGSSLEMAQTSVRPDTITLSLGLDIDMNMMDATWDDFALRDATPMLDSSVELPSRPINNRSITLDETHLAEELSSADLDFPGFPSSSAAAPSVPSRRRAAAKNLISSSSGNEPLASGDGGWPDNDDQNMGGWDDGMNGMPGEQLDLGLDLGEGWGEPPEGVPDNADMNWNDGQGQQDFDQPTGDFDADAPPPIQSTPSMNFSSVVRREMQARRRAKGPGMPVSSSPGRRPSRTPSLTRSPTPASPPDLPPSALKRPGSPSQAASRPKKRVRLLLDARTELTDAELLANREGYEAAMERAWRETASKKASDWVGEMLKDNVPNGYEAPELKEYWNEVISAGIEARKRRRESEPEDVPQPQRRRVGQVPASDEAPGQGRGQEVFPGDDIAFPVDDGGFRWNMDDAGMQMDDQQMNFVPTDDAFRSGTPQNDERIRTRSLSVELPRGDESQPDANSSQRNSSFPWEAAAAGPSSSSWGGPPGSGSGSGGRRSSSNIGSAGRGVQLVQRGNRSGSGTPSRREGSLVPSDLDSGTPRKHGSINQDVEDFHYQSQGEDAPVQATQSQSQDQDSLATLERNSQNFLEYAKQQLNVAGRNHLNFSHIVPADTSTSRVAAAGFYHCLVLATKSLLGVQQDEPYGELRLHIL